MKKISILSVCSASAVAQETEPLRVLFVGNSFIYGPAPQDRSDQLQLNNLPRMFKLIAESKGKRVTVAEDTFGGCTLHLHRPSMNPEGCTNEQICRLVNTTRMPASNNCTVSAEFMKGSNMSETYASCPQIFHRQPHGPWDVVVLQDNSALAPVQEARHRMLFPAFEEYAALLRDRISTASPAETKPILASYMTWSYYKGGTKWDSTSGSRSTCPGGFKLGCFPLGTLDEMTDCNNTDFHLRIDDQACQAYAIARGYAETLRYGADVLVPAGLAWQLARGSPEIPSRCKALIDAEYPDKGLLASLDLPLQARDAADARWRSDRDAQRLYRNMGQNYTSEFCDDKCTLDQHSSETSMYLNALVFFATLFKENPVGAGWPDSQTIVDGMLLPAVDPEEARALQRLARDTVMDNLDMWWSKKDDPDSCPWLKGSAAPDVLECVDGTSCSVAILGWSCCAAHGGRARCPATYPLMCEDTACVDGTEHCCLKECTANAGPRVCDAVV